MKTVSKILALLLLVTVLISSFVSCDAIAGLFGGDKGDDEPEHIDYVSNLKLDMNSTSAKQEVTVKLYIDGDTTHFYVPETISDTGVLKARYLAVNTPESTGKIEPWGKMAARFTKEKLESAESIILESDDEKWNLDSTGDRYLVWVWYKPAGEADYRNLNLEILQNGLAFASNSSQNRYGETCINAIAQAKAENLYALSNKKDPEMYDGDVVEVSLKELRTNSEAYDGVRVAFNAIVTKNDGQSVYVESYDEETEMYFGMSVYYGFTLQGEGLEIISTGNECRIIGIFGYSSVVDMYQVSDLAYNAFFPDDPLNIQLIAENKTPAYPELDASLLNGGTKTLTVTVKDEEGEETDTEKTFKYAELVLHSSASFKGLTIKDVYTTNNGGDSDGAMTITCEASDGTEIKVRTKVLSNAEGKLLTAEDFPINSIINAKGIIDSFDGEYQLKVLSAKDIEIIE